MYPLNDKKSAIRDVQQFLFVIGQTGDIPHLSVDGVYSEETTEAVKSFQALHSLKVTGKVERDTFDAIYKEYLRALVSNSGSEFDKSIFPMKLGESNNGVAVLNGFIRELSSFYPDLPITYGNFYSNETVRAVKLIQRYLRIEETGEATHGLYERIKEELTQIQNISNT